MGEIDLAISSWSFHTEFLNRRLRAEEFPRIARSMFGVRYIEFYDGDYAPDFMDPAVDEAYAEKIRASCEENDVQIACIAAVNDLTSPDEAKAERDLTRLEKWVRHCRILACPVLRINSGWLSLDEDVVEKLVQRLGCLLHRTEWADVVFAIENHAETLRGDFDTDLLLAVIERLDSSRVKACPDVGAMAPGYWQSGFSRLAPFAAHVHLKPSVLETGHFKDEERGMESYGPSVYALLRKHGYRGVASIEVRPPH